MSSVILKLYKFFLSTLWSLVILWGALAVVLSVPLRETRDWRITVLAFVWAVVTVVAGTVGIVTAAEGARARRKQG